MPTSFFISRTPECTLRHNQHLAKLITSSTWISRPLKDAAISPRLVPFARSAERLATASKQESDVGELEFFREDFRELSGMAGCCHAPNISRRQTFCDVRTGRRLAVSIHLANDDDNGDDEDGRTKLTAAPCVSRWLRHTASSPTSNSFPPL